MTIRVLIAEDQGMVLGALAALLEIEPDIDVVARARDGREALALAARTDPDVVLTDIEMPDMDGFEFAETIRADAHLSAMPIIALSSMVSPAAIERGRQAGFHDYVAKFDRPGLIAALKEQTADRHAA